MKNLVTLLVFAIAPLMSFGQGASCAEMDPICTDVGASFTANTGTTSEAGNNYGCLSTQPNPSWYYLEIATDGNLDMSLTAGSDIDFIIWGPFADLAAAQAGCGSFGANVDCSYSTTASETPSIPNAVTGEVYIMLITNYADVIQDITLTQTGGAGTTDCSIVTDPPCFMNNFEANISACDAATDTYSVTGLIEFDDPPTTGDLIVEDCNGNQTIVASAPFSVNGSGAGSENYTLNGSDANGLACGVTAYFTADVTCTLNLTYTAPICVCNFNFISYNVSACDPITSTVDGSGFVEFISAPSTGTLTISDCNGNQQVFNAPFTSPQTFDFLGIDADGTTDCSVTAVFSDAPACTISTGLFSYPPNCLGIDCPVDAGTFTTASSGYTTSSYELCFGDSFTITPNGDFVPPNDFMDGVNYDPGMWLLQYSCPPTIISPDPAFIPDPGNPGFSMPADPCFDSYYDWTNPASWLITNSTGGNNTFYYIPMTFYDYAGLYSYFYAGEGECYDLGSAIPVTFLGPITSDPSFDCFNGTASVIISGGAPAFDGSEFTVVQGSLTPANASFDNTTCLDGGTINLSGLVDGDNYSFEVVDQHNCPHTVSGTFQGMEDASFTYDFKYCQNDPNASPVITGIAGGNFTSTPTLGASLNAGTGVINLSTAPTGVYTIQYVSPANDCWGTETFTIVINPQPLVTATEDSPICDDGVSTINLGETGGEATSWAWSTDGGATITDVTLQNQVIYDATNGETFTVSVEDVNTGCINSDQVSVIVNPQDDPTFTTTDYCFGLANAATVTGTPGGTFSFNPAVTDGATIDVGTGEITGGVATTTYQIEYTTNGTCPLSLIVPVTVNPLPVITTSDESICLGGSIDITADGAGTGTYSWSPGTELNTTTGATVTSTPTADISYVVTGTDANGCVNVATSNITVSGNAPINAGGDVTICLTDITTLTATGGLTYSWDNGLGAGNDFDVSPGIGTTTYIVTGIDASGCSGTDQVDVTVDPLPTATITGTADVCIGDTDPIITFTGANGTAPYTFTYTLNGGANQTIVSTGNDATIAVSTAADGSFSYDLVSVDDASSTICSQVQAGNATVVVNPLPTATITGTADVCIGDTDPIITFTGANGTAPYTFTYTLNGGANQTIVSTGNDATITVSTAVDGAFSYDLVSVQDASTTTCSQVQTGNATVVVNPLPTAIIAGTTDVCIGDADPIVTFTGANGTAPYTFTYTLNGGANQTIVSTGNDATITVSTAVDGAFSYDLVSVQDASTTTCSQVQTGNATVVVNPLPTATISGTLDVCIGEADPSITFTGADGTAPYTFSYTINGGATQTVTSVGNTATLTVSTAVAGNFSYDLVSVQDASTTTCSQVQTGNATVVVNPLPTATIVGSVDVCEGDTDPTITFTGADGTAPYTFTYNINGGANQTLVSVGDDATLNVSTTPVGAYNYNLVSVEDASTTSCSQLQSGTATVNVNPNPAPIIDGVTEYCIGTSATLSTTMTYTSYLWSTGVTTPTANVTQADNPITVDVTNSFGCVATSAVFTVLENTVIVYNSTLQICAGDAIMIHGNSETVAGVYAQSFILGTGCDSTSSVTLVVNPLPIIDAGVDQFVCEGDMITLNATGAPNIVWDAVTVTNGIPFNQALGAITYTSTGTDLNGCVNTDVVDVTVNPLPTATITGSVDVCLGDVDPTITFTGADGTAPYTFEYSINGGATQTVVSIGDVATVAAPTNVAGTFAYAILSVEDASSTTCSQTQIGTATVIVNPLPTATIVGSVDVCAGDAGPSITFTGANGTAPYTFTYTINGGANQTVVSVGNTASVSASTLTPGPFIYDLVSVQDASTTACSQVQTGSATVVVNPIPTATISGNATVCNGDPSPLITLTGANGTAPYTFTYNLNGGANTTVVSIGNIFTFPAPGFDGTFDFNLVSVQDASSTACSQAQVGVATVIVNPLPTASIAGAAEVCVDEAEPLVTFTGADGTAPYTFTYNINGGANQTVISTGNTITVSAPTNAAGVFNYNLVSVQDASSTACSQSQVGTTTIVVNALPNASISGIANVCEGDIDPVITFTGTDGTAPYTFTYNIDGGANQTVVSIGDIATVNAPTTTSGTFVYNLVSVQDASLTACSQAQVGSVNVIVNPAPTATIAGDVELCIGGADQIITFTGAIGTEPYTFTYNVDGGPNQTIVSTGNTATISVPVLAAGTFNFNLVSVQDGSLSGCSQLQSGTATITVNPLPIVNAGNDIDVCEGDDVVLTASGANTYVWNNGVINGVSFSPSAGNYVVVGTDVNGCVGTDDLDLIIQSNPVVNFAAEFPPCEPFTGIFINNTITTGNAVSCVWQINNGDTFTSCSDTIQYTFPTAGTYDVTLTTTTDLGCSSSLTLTDIVSLQDGPVASFNPASTSLTSLSTDVQFNNTSIGAVAYEWIFGDETPNSSEVNPSHTFPAEGSGIFPVTLVAISNLGCTDTATAVVSVDEEIIYYVPNTFTPDNDDYNEYFKPIFTSGFDPFDYELLIFNRWGEIVFESHDSEIGWDGTYSGSYIVQDGTYTWEITFKTTNNDKRQTIHGHVNIVR